MEDRLINLTGRSGQAPARDAVRRADQNLTGRRQRVGLTPCRDHAFDSLTATDHDNCR